MFTNLYVNQGAEWIQAVDYTNDDGTPVNLTGYSFLSAFRISYNTPSLTGNISTTITNAVAGNTILSMNSAVTSNIRSGKYVYDVVMIDNFANKTRVLEGILTIEPGVTIR